MKRKVLLKANVLICVLLIVQTLATAIISYNSKTAMQKYDLERVASLVSESVYYQLEAYFVEPLQVAMTMANDPLLKELLLEKRDDPDNEQYIDKVQNYLGTYKSKYEYDSIFLVSNYTHRHYTSNDLICAEDWYYDFVDLGAEYVLNVDYDLEAVYMNCAVMNDDGELMGAIGVSIKISHLENMLMEYADKYDAQVWLLYEDNLHNMQYIGVQQPLTDEHQYYLSQLTADNICTFWDNSNTDNTFVNITHIPIIDWHLMVTNDMSVQLFQAYLIASIMSGVFVVFIILSAISYIIFRYNKQTIEILTNHYVEYKELLYKSTKELYENILEIDLTNNRIDKPETRDYLKSVGIDPNLSYDQILRVVAQNQVKPEQAHEFVTKLDREHMIDLYHQGLCDIEYDIMMKDRKSNYEWKRIKIRIFYWSSDESIQMILYRQQIHEDKMREAEFIAIAQQDSLTGLLNKAATTSHILNVLADQSPDVVHAIVIIDIDLFKNINDKYGHPVGDKVIKTYANRLRSFCTSSGNDKNICGRIGGDEFMVFISDVKSTGELQLLLSQLVIALREEIITTDAIFSVTPSIGAALYPQAGADFDTLYENADKALYETKNRGRNGFSIYNH